MNITQKVWQGLASSARNPKQVRTYNLTQTPPAPKESAVLREIYNKNKKAIDEGDWESFYRSFLKDKLSIVRYGFGLSKEFALSFIRGYIDRRISRPLRFQESRDGFNFFLAAKDGGKIEVIKAPIDETQPKMNFGDSFLADIRRKTGLSDALFLRKIETEGKPKEKIHLSHLAALNEAQYQKWHFYGDWERDIDFDRKCKDENLYPKSRCGLYVHRKSKTAVLVFEGTRFGPKPDFIEDMITNIRTMKGLGTTQYAKGPSVARAAQDIYPDLIVTGHSKGGGVAQLSALLTNAPCVVFNTVGVPALDAIHPDDTKPGHIGYQRNIPTVLCYVKGDPISNPVENIDPRKGASICLPYKEIKKQPLLNGDIIMLDPGHEQLELFSRHSVTTCFTALKKTQHYFENPFKKAKMPSSSLLRKKDGTAMDHKNTLT